MNSNNSLKLYELASEIINKCRSKKLKISVAESCTGGLISSIITSIPGSSDVFECGFITYSNNSKRKFLNVSQNTLSLYGAVSEEVVIEMINGLKLIHSLIFYWQFLVLQVLEEEQKINQRVLFDIICF